MKKHNKTFAGTLTTVLITVTLLATSCSKTPKPIDLGSIAGRWCHVSDTTRHFYIDSATSTTAIVRYPTQLNAPLGTYIRFVFSLSFTGRGVELVYPMVIGRYSLYKVGGKWRGIEYQNTKDSINIPIEIMQVDNYRNQPGPDVMAPL